MVFVSCILCVMNVLWIVFEAGKVFLETGVLSI